MEGGGFKEELNQLRSRIRQQNESSAANLFPTDRMRAEARRKNIRKFSAAVREWKKDKRVVGAVRGYFDIVPQEFLQQVEEMYPYMASRLLSFSENLLNGVYGDRLQLGGRSRTEEVINWPVIVKGILVEAYKDQEGGFPEILESIKEDAINLIKRTKKTELEKIFVKGSPLDEIIYHLKVDQQIKKAMMKLFVRYLDNIAHPSSVSVGMWVDREDSVRRSLDIASKIKNPSQRFKSFANIVDKLMEVNRIERAMQVIRTMKPVEDRAKILNNVVERLLIPQRKVGEEQIDEAIDLAETLDVQEEKDDVLHRIASGLAKHQVMEKAMQVVQKIRDSDTRNLTLSNIVSALAQLESYDRAGEIARLIPDSDFRKDAYEYIVKSLLERKSFRAALDFVDSISDPAEQTYAAKLILSSVRSKHEESKVQEVCEHFHLS